MSEVDEDELLYACRAGRVLDCADGSGRQPIAAAVLRRCCLDRRDEIDARGIRLRNATVLGALDLAGVEVSFPLWFESCDFEAALLLEGANLHSLALTGRPCLPGLLANGLWVRRDVDLSRSVITGGHFTSASTSKRSAVWLCESEIGGHLLCVDTIIRADGERALQADQMRIGGTVRVLHGFTAVGEIRFIGAQIEGSLDLTGVSIERPDGLALDLGEATIGGSVFLIDEAQRYPVIRGRVDMGSARLAAQLLIRNATFDGSLAAPVGGT